MPRPKTYVVLKPEGPMVVRSQYRIRLPRFQSYLVMQLLCCKTSGIWQELQVSLIRCHWYHAHDSRRSGRVVDKLSASRFVFCRHHAVAGSLDSRKERDPPGWIHVSREKTGTRRGNLPCD